IPAHGGPAPWSGAPVRADWRRKAAMPGHARRAPEDRPAHGPHGRPAPDRDRSAEYPGCPATGLPRSTPSRHGGWNRSSATSEQQLFLGERDVRRVGTLHADNVIAGIDVMHLAGDAARKIGQQIKRAVADLIDCDRAAHRCVVLVPLQNVAEIADTGGRERL